MGFVKVQKNNAYFKRYQVKYRRRREGKTDYLQRRLMVTQAKNKYQAAKYRLVARISNRHVTCQIVSAELKGDRTHASAYSHELKDYGIKVGLSNYAACYATGLLCARRILTLKGLDKKYQGVKECDGEHFQFDEKKYKREKDGSRPFKAFLDIGLARPTIGNRVFACLKGAVDGGLNVPHSDKRFPGYNPSTGSLDAEVHRSRIMGAHVGEWMEEMQEEDPDKYKLHFSKYIAEGLEDVDALEEVYVKAHEEIRKNPKAKNPTENAAAKKKKAGDKKPRSYKLKANRPYNLAQRKYRATQKLNAVRRRLGMEDRKP
eukprot:TRINITY_DN268_c0_g1_i1.p1 TRINITY_DN268_c0_g1~~TRINITY_DN268_c0_g1_i1.p1  ORF type:complete len:317 (+),score=79.32 TRINITY_DN268_c0_g1_i1:48-998(+)